jgi:hypothetical protein
VRTEHVADGLPPDVVEDERLDPGADLRHLRPVLPPLRRGLAQVQLHHRGDPRDVARDHLPRRDLLVDGLPPVPALVDVHVAQRVADVVAEARRGRAEESVGGRRAAGG